MHRACVAHALAALLAPSLGGCIVGVQRFDAPERAAAAEPPVPARDFTFEVRVVADPRETPGPWTVERRERWERSTQQALAARGVDATPVEQEPASADHVHFTVTVTAGLSYAASAVVSFLTFSVIPGYLDEWEALDVEIVDRRPGAPPSRHHHRYEKHERLFIWLPFIVHPDLVGSLNAASESERAKERRAADAVGTMDRLAADLIDDGRAEAGPEWESRPR